MGPDRPAEGRDALTIVDGVLYGADDLVKQWVAQHIVDFYVNPLSTALGVVEGDELIAGVVYERHNGIHLEVSIAADSTRPWASRAVLRRLFAYPFVQLECVAISCLVPMSNLASLNLATKLGFSPEAYVKFAAPDGSPMVVLKMLREQCRWIEGHGQGQQGTGGTGSLQDSAG